MDILHRLEDIQGRISRACERSKRDPSEVRLIAVTKNVPADLVRQGMECGLRRFGENYVQEALPKIQALGPEAEWHFIGHLQSNKARHVVGRFRMVHTVDRLSLARELDRRVPGPDPLEVLVQVNISGEETKSGVSPDGLAQLLQVLIQLPRIRVRGLMTMPPYSEDPETSRPCFRLLRELRDRTRALVLPPHSLDELSMGMTGDFEVAIEEGATFIRIGTALFGPRPG